MPTEITTKGELLAASGGSPVLRGEVPSATALPALFLEGDGVWAAAFLRPTHVHGLNVMLHAGDTGQAMSPGAVAALDELVRSSPFATWLAAARQAGATHASLPRASVGAIGALLADAEHAVGRWEWMWTETAPPAPALPVIDLRPATKGEIDDLLQTHNARTDGRPFAHPDQRWVGVRGDDGALMAVGCCEIEQSGAPILAGITVAAHARGRGLGRAVTAELTRGAVAEHGWCTLGMYSDNPVARGLYLDLGYRLGAEWTSGAMAG